MKEAIIGLIGIIIGATFQGFFNFQLERQKFESALILKAIETGDPKKAADNLLFLVRAGFLEDKNGQIAALKKNPEGAPVLPSGSNRLRPMMQLGQKPTLTPEIIKKLSRP